MTREEMNAAMLAALGQAQAAFDGRNLEKASVAASLARAYAAALALSAEVTMEEAVSWRP